MERYRPLTDVEALALNRKQFLDRVDELTRFWEGHRAGGHRRTARARAAEAAFVEVRNRHVPDPFFDHVVYRYHADPLDPLDVLAERDPGYWLTRLDGSPPRPPGRVQRSRVRGARLPFGCRIVTRPGPYGNPVGTVDPTVPGDFPVLRFRNYLVRRNHFPEHMCGPYSYPSNKQIVHELSYWDLACWCPLSDEPFDRCHADVLLRVAAGQEP